MVTPPPSKRSKFNDNKVASTSGPLGEPPAIRTGPRTGPPHSPSQEPRHWLHPAPPPPFST